jgi:hypothetical protein
MKGRKDGKDGKVGKVCEKGCRGIRYDAHQNE